MRRKVQIADTLLIPAPTQRNRRKEKGQIKNRDILIEWKHHPTRHEVRQDILEIPPCFIDKRRINAYLAQMSSNNYEQQLLEIR